MFFHALTERHPVTHAIFNLPAMGVELLDCFRGLDYAKHNLPRPLVAWWRYVETNVLQRGKQVVVGYTNLSQSTPRTNVTQQFWGLPCGCRRRFQLNFMDVNGCSPFWCNGEWFPPYVARRSQPFLVVPQCSTRQPKVSPG